MVRLLLYWTAADPNITIRDPYGVFEGRIGMVDSKNLSSILRSCNVRLISIRGNMRLRNKHLLVFGDFYPKPPNRLAFSDPQKNNKNKKHLGYDVWGGGGFFFKFLKKTAPPPGGGKT